MKETSIGCLFVTLFIILTGALGWAIQGNDFFMFKFFAPKYANVQREVFENTKSYRQGMVQQLQQLQLEYARTTDANAKATIRSVVLHRYADFPEDACDSDLRAFLRQMRSVAFSPATKTDSAPIFNKPQVQMLPAPKPAEAPALAK
jgi:hypothetical protein